jgi:hypothetical protein
MASSICITTPCHSRRCQGVARRDPESQIWPHQIWDSATAGQEAPLPLVKDAKTLF